MNIRNATRHDAGDLAYLINLAGEGLSDYLWGRMAEAGESPLEFGAREVAREEGDVSYRHARVCVQKGRIVGLLLEDRLPAPDDLEDLADCPSAIRPLRRLQAKASGSWHIRALATREAARGKGVARLLMAQAEASAIAAGCLEMSVIVASENPPARRLFDRLGFAEIAALPVVPYPGGRHDGDWLLMTRALDLGGVARPGEMTRRGADDER